MCPRGVAGGGQEGPRHPQDALLLGGGPPQVAGGAPHPCRGAPTTGFTPRGGGGWDGQLGTSQPRHRHGLQAAGQWDLRAGPRTQGGRGVGGSPRSPPGSQGPGTGAVAPDPRGPSSLLGTRASHPAKWGLEVGALSSSWWPRGTHPPPVGHHLRQEAGGSSRGASAP